MASKIVVVTFLLLCIIFEGLSLHVDDQSSSSTKIAVIGGGIGGASSAFFLRQLFGKDAEIDVYEKGEIGGRLALVSLDNKMYEAGGSIIHQKNAYMVNFTNLLGLEKQATFDERFGLYNGKEIIFEGSTWFVVTIAKLLWQYGWNIVKLNTFLQNLLSKFERIYKHQDDGLAFTTPERLLESMDGDLLEYLHYSLEEILAYEGFSQKLIDELVMAAMKCNYGQTPDAQAFVGIVSLFGAEGELWSVKGGNKLIPEGLLEKSNVNLIKSKVTKISHQQVDGKTQLEVKSTEVTRIYDLVIVATPLHNNISDISFINFPEPIVGFQQHYHRTVATFVQGLPNFSKFGYKELSEFPEAILVTQDKSWFNSLGIVHHVDACAKCDKDKQEQAVWKVFSQQPLMDSEMSELFLSHDDTRIVDWSAAYPHYSSSEVNLPSFRLAPQLYYVNTIELAASCMEMMAIAARNVALLAHYDWTGQSELVNPYVHGEFGRQEL